jgi:hypothetical protein
VTESDIPRKRAKFKKTVESALPPPEDIEATRVLSDAEQAELARRFEEARTNKELADLLGREGLRAVLKQKFAESAQQAQRLTQRFEKR